MVIQMKTRTKIIIAVFTVVTSSVALLLVVVAAFPLRLDELLLTNDELCGVDANNLVDPNDYQDAHLSGWKLGLASTQKHMVTLFHHSADLVVWTLAVHLWNRHHLHSARDETCKVCNNRQADSTADQSFLRDTQSSNILRKCPNDTEDTRNIVEALHPMCQTYREFRTRLRIQQISIPWNWYYSCRLRLKRLSIHSAVSKSHRDESPHFVSELGCISSPSMGVLELSNLHNSINLHSEKSDYAQTALPPSMEIESVDISFQSWTQPVVSVHAKDIALNVVIQKGLLSLPLSFPKKDNDTNDSNTDSQTDENGGFSLLIGDMTIQDAVELIPKPPEREGIHPMIGVVNVSNVTVYLWERSSKKGQQQKPLHLLTKLKIPDEFFIPVVDLTSANQPDGIDRFHFQRLLELEFANSFRRHLFSEAEEALRHSWTMASEFSDLLKEQGNKMQDKLQNLVHKTQLLYVDRWIELGARALQETGQNLWQGWINNTSPLTNAMETWMQDMRTIISEPMDSPLKIVMIHHWNKIFDGFNRQDVIEDKVNWTLNDLKYAFKEMKSTIHRMITKSKDDIDQLVTSCEGEIKEMWLSWHLQFLPDLD